MSRFPVNGCCAAMVLGLLAGTAAAQVNLLQDPTFSLGPDGALDCTAASLDKPFSASWSHDGSARRNPSTHIPTCPRDPGGDNDPMRGGISSGDPNPKRCWQTVAGLTTNQAYELTGEWSVGNDTPGLMQYRAQLREGNENGTLLSETGGSITTGNFFDWTPLSVTGTPTSGTTMTVVFTISSGSSWGAKTVSFDDLSLMDAGCTNPPTVSGASPDHEVRGSTPNVQINGANFVAGTTSVKLVQGGTEIAGTSVNVDGSGTFLTADFDLTSAPLGFYDIVVSIAGCPDGVLAAGFNVIVPGPGLSNGSFELPVAAGGCPVVELGGPTDWRGIQFDFYGGGFYLRDEPAVFPPTCPPPDGDHYASTDAINAGGGMNLTQTVSVTPAVPLTLTGYFAGGGLNRVTISLLEGDIFAAPIPGAQVEVYNQQGQYDWTLATASGTPTGDLVTVRWEVTNESGDGVPKAAHIDNLVLTQCAGTLTATAVDDGIAPNDGILNDLGITGSGFSGGTPDVFLVTVGLTVPGTDVNVTNDTTMTADFDLTGAPTGNYDLIVTKDGCAAQLDDAVLVLSATLINGSFELPDVGAVVCGPPSTPVIGLPTGWNTDAPSGLNRDGNAPNPSSCPSPDGGHFGSMSEGSGGTVRAWQTLAVSPGSVYTFAGRFDHPAGVTTTLRLLDGDENGTELNSTVQSGLAEWAEASVSAAAPVSGVMTVVWEQTLTSTPPDVGGHADGLTFVATIACNDPFADTDGDGDVDGDDFGVIQRCITGSGPGNPPIPNDPVYCACFDRNGDQDIDQADVGTQGSPPPGTFEACASGPTVPANPACDD